MAVPRALQLRRHFQRVVLTRPWLTFVVMGLALIGATIIDSQLNRRPARDSQ